MTGNFINIGIIGCGNISSIYLKYIARFDHLHLRACADLDEDDQIQAEKIQIPKVYAVVEMLADPEIYLIINLTILGAHAKFSIDILNAGKHVYIEKPLANSDQLNK